jgi:transforming growth factor-beta-induced protein
MLSLATLQACGDDSDSSSAGTGAAGTDAAGTGAAGTDSAGTGAAGTGAAGTGAMADAGTDSAMPEPKDIVDTAVAAGSFTKLAAALTTAGLVDTLKGAGPFTVFAPTDDAFAAFETANPGVLAGLTKEELTAILTYHVVSGSVASTDLKDGAVALTVNGSPIVFGVGSDVTVDDAKVTTADIAASNGIIHVIDAIMLPPADDIVDTAVAAGSFTKLAGALTTAELVDTLKGAGPFTVFAPTDDAFAAFETANPGVLAGLTKEELTAILTYHVASGAVGAGNLMDAQMIETLNAGKSLTVSLGADVKINDAKVTMANVLAKNGVIHVIDTVLTPQ